MPRFLLTRPKAQNAAFAKALRARLGEGVSITASPVSQTVFLQPDLPAGHFSALIFTSQTGVEAYRRLGLSLSDRAFCVGDRTAAAATALGLNAVSAHGDAAALIDLLRAQPGKGRYLHLRGQEARGDVAGNLRAAGLDVHSAITYAQQPCQLSAEALGVLQGEVPVLLPLFSPRSAALLSGQIVDIPQRAPLLFAAISPATAQQLHPDLKATVTIAARPDAEAMMTAIFGLFDAGTVS